MCNNNAHTHPWPPDSLLCCEVQCMWMCHCTLSTAAAVVACAACMFRTSVMSQQEPDQLRWEWLTTTVSVRGLCRSILQAVQDFAFAHVAVSYQEELQQVVVAFHWAALAAHPVSHGGRGSSLQEAEGETKQHPYALLFPDTQSVMPWMFRMRVWESLFCLLTVFKTVGSLISGKEKKIGKRGSQSQRNVLFGCQKCGCGK